MRRTQDRHGWGLTEVIIAAVIVLVLILALIPAVMASREQARRELCLKRQAELATGLLKFDAFQRRLPGYRNDWADDDQGVSQPAGWIFPMLTYLDLDKEGNPRRPEYRALVGAYGPEGAGPQRGRTPAVYLAALVCPGDAPEESQLVARPNWLSFVANCGQPDAAANPPIPPDWPASGVFFNRFAGDGVVVVPMSVAMIEAADGTDHTLLLSENLDAGQWTDSHEAQVGFLWAIEPEADLGLGKVICRINQLGGQGDGTIRFARPSSRHSGGVNAVLVSSAGRFLSDDTDPVVFMQMMTSDGKNVKIAGRDEPASPPFRVE